MRLIDADRLINVVKNSIEFNKEYCLDNLFTKGYRAGMRDTLRHIKEQASVDFVKHGEWIRNPHIWYIRYKCSACGNIEKKQYYYCPSCGAKMYKN